VAVDNSSRLSASRGRRFAFPVGSAFLVLAGVAAWRDAATLAGTLATIGVALLVAGAVVPSRLGPVERAWMALAHAISRVTTPVVMSVAWLLVITPSGLLRRALGGNPLHHLPREGSYWKRRPPGSRRSDLTRPF
jgi:hypothetical protein